MKFKEYFSLKELVIISFTFLSLIYSTSFHYANSPPNDTFEPAQFLVHTSPKDGGDVNIAKYFHDYGFLYNELFTNGSWPKEFHPRNITGWNDMWKSSAMSVDNAYYIMYAAYYAGLIDKIDYSIPGADLTMAVHKYRVLLPMIVGTISKIQKFSKSNYEWSEKYKSRIVYIYLVLNFIFIFTTAFLFLFFLINVFSFGKLLSIIGAILFITLPLVSKSAGFPQAEPIALLLTLLIFISVYYKKKFYFLILALLGLMVKDLFIYTSVLWFFNFQFFKEKAIQKYIQHFIISTLPIIFFILIRFYYSDGSGLETRGTYDLLKGELPPFLMGSSIYYHLEKYFLVFTFLWAGIFNINKNDFLKRSSFTLIFLTFISFWIARGSGIERHVGLMYPIIIPLFLYFFKNIKDKESI
tara:strand:- start:2596 stop:3828 length:1233 start_codon:yes stop_codon:yes gene_type:complete